jgi:hypothetical protein
MGYFNLSDFCLDASNIARRINALATLMVGGMDQEVRISEKARYYWGLAELLGIKAEVDIILQAPAEKETQEAIERMRRK